MDTVTYSTNDVAKCIEENVIPLRVASDIKPLADEYNVIWTPDLSIIGADKKVYYRSIGFQPAEVFNPWLLLGIGMYHYGHKRFSEAVETLDLLLSDYPKSPSAPESIFYHAVSSYKSTNSVEPLKKAYEKIKADHAESEWALKTLPYRLL
jgi:hypothetical protein